MTGETAQPRRHQAARRNTWSIAASSWKQRKSVSGRARAQPHTQQPREAKRLLLGLQTTFMSACPFTKAIGTKATVRCLCVKIANGDVKLCIGSAAKLACFCVKLLSTMSQLYIGPAAKLLCFCVKTLKGCFKLCIGSVARLLRSCSMDKKRNSFFYFFSTGRNPYKWKG